MVTSAESNEGPPGQCPLCGAELTPPVPAFLCPHCGEVIDRETGDQRSTPEPSVSVGDVVCLDGLEMTVVSINHSARTVDIEFELFDRMQQITMDWGFAE